MTATTTASTSTGIPAVHNCCTVYQHVLAVERGKGISPYEAHKIASTAYLKAMPYLTDRTSISDFIACMGHAMLLEIISLERGSKLLHAARTALGALPREPRPGGRPSRP